MLRLCESSDLTARRTVSPTPSCGNERKLLLVEEASKSAVAEGLVVRRNSESRWQLGFRFELPCSVDEWTSARKWQSLGRNSLSPNRNDGVHVAWPHLRHVSRWNSEDCRGILLNLQWTTWLSICGDCRWWKRFKPRLHLRVSRDSYSREYSQALCPFESSFENFSLSERNRVEFESSFVSGPTHCGLFSLKHECEQWRRFHGGAENVPS